MKFGTGNRLQLINLRTSGGRLFFYNGFLENIFRTLSIIEFRNDSWNGRAQFTVNVKRILANLWTFGRSKFYSNCSLRAHVITIFGISFKPLSEKYGFKHDFGPTKNK